MIPNFMKRGNGNFMGMGSGSPDTTSPTSSVHGVTKDSSSPDLNLSGLPNMKRRGSLPDFVTKSGQLLTNIQGTLDKQIGHFTDAVHITGHDNSEFFSPLPAVSARDFDVYLGSVKEHWSEYKDICASLIRTKAASVAPPTESEELDINAATNAFRDIPQVFFHSDYKHSGFEQHQIFTQPIRVSVQNQSAVNTKLSGYMRTVEQHLVKHLSNVDSLLRSLMSIASIQSDIGIAHDRVVATQDRMSIIRDGEVRAGLELVQLARRRARMEQVVKFLDFCETVRHAKPGIEALVQVGDFASATELVQATKDVLANELPGVRVVDGIRSYIEDHGKSIDSVMESEFAELFTEAVFPDNPLSAVNEKRMISTISSMHARGLLLQSLQIKVKENLVKRIRKEVKHAQYSSASSPQCASAVLRQASGDSIDSSQHRQASVANMLTALNARMSRLAQLVRLIDSVVKDSVEAHMVALTCLRVFEAVSAAGLARTAQSVTESLTDPGAHDPASPQDLLTLPQLRSVRACTSSGVAELERLYSTLFESISCDIAEHLSFSSSVIKSGSQNGFSPDIDSTIAAVARQRLSHFHQAALDSVETALKNEKWDKPCSPSVPVVDALLALDPEPSERRGSSVDTSPMSATSAASAKFVKVNKVTFLLVPAALPSVGLMHAYVELAMAVPGVAIDALGRLSLLLRALNTSTRDLVLEGRMSVVSKKVINATNLALSSQYIGLMGQLVSLGCKRFCEWYGISSDLVFSGDSEDSPRVGRSVDVLPEDPEAALQDLLVQTVMELNDHRRDIYMKLGDILIARFEFHSNLWLSPAAAGSVEPIEGIVKDFSMMYKVLLKSLQTENLKRIFSRVFSECSSHFERRVDAACLAGPPKSLAELACKLRTDLLFLLQQLQSGEALSGLKSPLYGMIADMLEVVVKKLPLIDVSVTAEAAVEKLRAILQEGVVDE